MKNRVGHLLNSLGRKDLGDSSQGLGLKTAYEGQTKKCTFCHGSLGAERSLFNFLSEDCQEAICSNCVDKFARLVNISRAAKMPKEALREKMAKAISVEDAPQEAKDQAVEIAMRLATRSASLMTSIPDKPLRGTFRTEDAERLCPLIAIAALEAGIITVIASRSQCSCGMAAKALLGDCVGDENLLEHAAILVPDEPLAVPGEFSVVFVSAEEEE